MNVYLEVDLGAAQGSRQQRLNTIQQKLAAGINGRISPDRQFHFAGSTDGTATVPGRYILLNCELTDAELADLQATFGNAVTVVGGMVGPNQPEPAVFAYITAAGTRYRQPTVKP